MISIQRRIAFGFIAGAISVLTFHQAAWAIFHYLALPGLGMPPPFPINPVPPLHVPRILDLSFWGGLWGMLFAVVWRGPRASNWWAGIILGVCASLFGFFVVSTIKGLPIAGGWVLNSWIRSILINGTWGLGIGLLLTVLPFQTVSQDDHAYR